MNYLDLLPLVKRSVDQETLSNTHQFTLQDNYYEYHLDSSPSRKNTITWIGNTKQFVYT